MYSPGTEMPVLQQELRADFTVLYGDPTVRNVRPFLDPLYGLVTESGSGGRRHRELSADLLGPQPVFGGAALTHAEGNTDDCRCINAHLLRRQCFLPDGTASLEAIVEDSEAVAAATRPYSCPTARSGHVLLSCPERASLLLYGGLEEESFNDVWEYHVHSRRWHQLHPTPAPVWYDQPPRLALASNLTTRVLSPEGVEETGRLHRSFGSTTAPLLQGKEALDEAHIRPRASSTEGTTCPPATAVTASSSGGSAGAQAAALMPAPAFGQAGTLYHAARQRLHRDTENGNDKERTVGAKRATEEDVCLFVTGGIGSTDECSGLAFSLNLSTASWQLLPLSTPLPQMWGSVAHTLRVPRGLHRTGAAVADAPNYSNRSRSGIVAAVTAMAPLPREPGGEEEEEEEEVIVIFGGMNNETAANEATFLLYIDHPLTEADVHAQPDFYLSETGFSLRERATQYVRVTSNVQDCQTAAGPGDDDSANVTSSRPGGTLPKPQLTAAEAAQFAAAQPELVDAWKAAHLQALVGTFFLQFLRYGRASPLHPEVEPEGEEVEVGLQGNLQRPEPTGRGGDDERQPLPEDTTTPHPSPDYAAAARREMYAHVYAPHGRRRSSSAVYRKHFMFVFGGRDGFSSYYNDLWVFNVLTRMWIQWREDDPLHWRRRFLENPGDPQPGQVLHYMAKDRFYRCYKENHTRKDVVLARAIHEALFSTPRNSPVSARTGSCMAIDPVHHRLYIYGGFSFRRNSLTTYGDLHVLYLQTGEWQRVSTGPRGIVPAVDGYMPPPPQTRVGTLGDPCDCHPRHAAISGSPTGDVYNDTHLLPTSYELLSKYLRPAVAASSPDGGSGVRLTTRATYPHYPTAPRGARDVFFNANTAPGDENARDDDSPTVRFPLPVVVPITRTMAALVVDPLAPGARLFLHGGRANEDPVGELFSLRIYPFTPLQKAQHRVHLALAHRPPGSESRQDAAGTSAREVLPPVWLRAAAREEGFVVLPEPRHSSHLVAGRGEGSRRPLCEHLRGSDVQHASAAPGELDLPTTAGTAASLIKRSNATYSTPNADDEVLLKHAALRFLRAALGSSPSLLPIPITPHPASQGTSALQEVETPAEGAEDPALPLLRGTMRMNQEAALLIPRAADVAQESYLMRQLR